MTELIIHIEQEHGPLDSQGNEQKKMHMFFGVDTQDVERLNILLAEEIELFGPITSIRIEPVPVTFKGTQYELRQAIKWCCRELPE